MRVAAAGLAEFVAVVGVEFDAELKCWSCCWRYCCHVVAP